MRELPARKNVRLKKYNYSQEGAYFITICVKDRHEMLGRVVGRDALGAPFVQISEYGEIIRKEIEKTHLYYTNVVVEKFIIMPNHVHMIVSVSGETEIHGQNGAPGASRPTTALIPRIVTMLKKKTNKTYGFDMWQTSYHDRIIRNESEYQKIWQYIDENPVR